MAKKRSSPKTQSTACDIRRVRCGSSEHTDFEMRIDPEDDYPVRIISNPGPGGAASGSVDEMIAHLQTMLEELESWKRENAS